MGMIFGFHLETLGFSVVLLPLIASVVAGLFGRVIGPNPAMWLTSGAVTVSAFLSWMIYYVVAFKGHHPIEATLMPWIDMSGLFVSFGLLLDKLTAAMLVVVTTVSACVHWYSLGYMAHDPSKQRFFSYLSFFTFTMLVLVTAPNLLQMFLGWEGVGLASYLLIGFWHHKKTANAAAMKAFIVNRVADVGLLLGLLTTFMLVGSLDYYDLFASVQGLSERPFTFWNWEFSAVDVLAALFLIGAMGKSAQIGFHTWLPDAMEGPTPVSALIHAATMVTAGVFLICRLSPLYEYAPSVLLALAWVGAVTAIFAASIGLTQKDIKRVIAYSTCSQLGYMFFACGVSAYAAAMFHLTTHAFFKALLFLAAGSVIHAMHDEQDMFKMGGLKKVLFVTYPLVWIGSLALMGIPPFAGFFSKDLILEAAFMSGGNMGIALYTLGVTAAFMTAFYSMRVLHLTFHGKTRAEKKVFDDAHESGPVMLWPMVFLAVGAVIGGWFFSGMGHTDWWAGAIFVGEGHTALEDAHHTPPFFKYLPLFIVLAAIGISCWFYLGKSKVAARFSAFWDFLYLASLNKWFIDELYQTVIVSPVRWISTFLWKKGDEQGIDRFGPNGAAWLALRVGSTLRLLQTGYIYHYAFVIICSICAVLTWILMR